MPTPKLDIRPPTIKEVAKLAGVSFKTVARVINNEPHVRVSTRETVVKAMEMLKYAPNISGRQLSSRRSFLVALLFNVAATFVARAQSGAIRKCRESGYHVIVEEVPIGFEQEVAGRLHQLRVDGVVVLPPLSYNPDLLQALRERGLKVVQIAPDDPDAPFVSVGINDFEAGYAVTSRLIELGHTEIAFIAGGKMRASTSRRDGYRKALNDARLPIRVDLELTGHFTYEGGESCGRELFSRAECPTAIFAANDLMARGVAVAAQKAGLSVPGDVSISGFDDSPAASHGWPELTTVRQPLEEMTSLAVEILLGGRELPAGEFHQLPYALIERGSTAPPPVG